MLPIRPTTGVTTPVRAARAAGSRAGFQVPAQTAAAEPAAMVEAAALDGLLAVQEESGALAVGQPGMVDREARRHGEDMLRELAALQRALLGGGASEAGPALQRLATLAATAPAATSPALRAALAAVALRADVELARHAARAAAELSLVAAPRHGYSPPE